MPSTQGIQWCGSLHSIFTLSPHSLHSLCPTYGSTYLDASHRSTKLTASFGCGIFSSRCRTNGLYPIGLRFDFANASSPPQSRVAVRAWSLAYHNLNTMSMLLLGCAGVPFLLSLPCLRLSVVTACRIVTMWSRSHVPCMSIASFSKNNVDELMSFAKVFALMVPLLFSFPLRWIQRALGERFVWIAATQLPLNESVLTIFRGEVSPTLLARSVNASFHQVFQLTNAYMVASMMRARHSQCAISPSGLLECCHGQRGKAASSW